MSHMIGQLIQKLVKQNSYNCEGSPLYTLFFGNLYHIKSIVEILNENLYFIDPALHLFISSTI